MPNALLLKMPAWVTAPVHKLTMEDVTNIKDGSKPVKSTCATAFGPGLVAATVREPAHFTIEVPLDPAMNLADDRGLLQLPSDDNLVVSIRGVSRVHPHLTPRPLDYDRDPLVRTYDVEWRPVLSGHYQIVIFHGSHQLEGSPFEVVAATPQPCPMQCWLHGDALCRAVAHKTETFSIAYRDKLGITTHATELDVFVEPVQSGSPRARITRCRKIRVKVGGRPISVRAEPDLDSEEIGELLPGAIITIVEERIGRGGNVEACIALDFMEKVDRNGKPILSCPRKPGMPPTTDAKTLSFWSTPSPSDRRAGPSALPLAFAPAAAVPTSTLNSIPEDDAVEGGRQLAAPSRLGARPLSSIPEARAAGASWTAASSTSTSTSAANGAPLSKSEQQQRLRAAAAPSGSSSANGAPSCGKLAANGTVPGGQGGGQVAPSSPNSHVKVQKKFGMKLSTADAAAAQQQVAGAQQQSSRRSSRSSGTARSGGKRSSRKLDWSAQQAARTVGWATIVKDGAKLVTSRMRLNVEMRQQYQQQWARRLATVKSAEGLKKTMGDGTASSKSRSSRASIDHAVMRSITLELESAKAVANTAAFAYGGIYPGLLHSHGKLSDSHRVSYSIGVAGVYLLHVRLRQQGAALPGSPFMLTVRPGEAHALSTKLPAVLHGEVGGRCSYTISTADQGGNPCLEGGATLSCLCESEDDLWLRTGGSSSDNGKLNAKSTDHGNGKYTIVWHGERTGTFLVSVTIGGLHVVGSPMRLKLTSTIPDLTKCLTDVQRSIRAVKGQLTMFRIRFRDVYGNSPNCSGAFRSSITAGLAIANPGVKVPTARTEYDFEGSWVDEESDDGTQIAWYQIAFTPMTAGSYSMHAWVESNAPRPVTNQVPGVVRNYMEGSPYILDVHADAANVQSGVREVIDLSGIMPGDYKISRDVFEETTKRWGDCTIDAFASVATAMLPRFWTETPKLGAEGTDALKQEWRYGERVWAHPPLHLLDALAAFLVQPDRGAEVIVCAPFRPNADWFFKIKKLSNDSTKYMAGRLSKVADDAPSRVHEWPMILFRIPGRNPGAGGPTRPLARPQPQSLPQVPQLPIQPCAGKPLLPPPSLPQPPPDVAAEAKSPRFALSMANIAKIIREHPHLRPQIKAIMSRKYLDQKQSILEIQQLLHNAFGPAAAERTDAQAAEAPVGETPPVKAASVLGALSRGAPRAPAAAVLPVQDPLSTYAEVDAIAPGPPAEISMVTESGRRRSRALEHVSIKGRASTSSFASTCTASTTSTTSTRI